MKAFKVDMEDISKDKSDESKSMKNSDLLFYQNALLPAALSDT